MNKKYFFILISIIIIFNLYSVEKYKNLPEELKSDLVILRYDTFSCRGSILIKNAFRDEENKNKLSGDLNKITLKKEFLKTYFKKNGVISIDKEILVKTDKGYDVEIRYYLDKETIQATYEVLKEYTYEFYTDQVCRIIFKDEISARYDEISKDKIILRIDIIKPRPLFKGNSIDMKVNEEEKKVSVYFDIKKAFIEIGYQNF